MPDRVLLVVDAGRGPEPLRPAWLLADRLAEHGFEAHLAVIGPQASLPKVGGDVPRTLLRRRHRFDPFVAWRLRRLARHLRPRLVHAWGAGAEGFARCVDGARRVTTFDEPPRSGGALERLAHRVTPPAGLVVAASEAVAQAINRQDAPPPRVIRPGVAMPEARSPEALIPDAAAGDRETLFGELGLPPTARVVTAATQLIPKNQTKELIWAADLVRVVREDLRLLVVGAGPELPALARFARTAAEPENIRFLGERDDLPAVLAHSEVFWHAGPAASAPPAVLAAMAAGLPVVADQTPGCADALVDGETGRLTPAASRADRGRATEALLADPEAARAMGDAARAAVAVRFSVDRMAADYAEAYRGLLG